jgi:hypothetical protein
LLSALPVLPAAEPPACDSCAPVGRGHGAWDRFRDPCATIPPGAVPAPNGSSVRTWEGLMADRAKADRFVVYLHEWYMGGRSLGPYGCAHLRRIAVALPQGPDLVVLQPALSPELNESRRLLLVQILLSAGVADAEQRVVVAFPAAEGMTGEEAARVYDHGHGGYGGQGRQGVGNPLQPIPGGLTPFGGFTGGFRGGLGGGYSGF